MITSIVLRSYRHDACDSGCRSMASRFILETLPQNKTQMVGIVNRKDGDACRQDGELKSA